MTRQRKDFVVQSHRESTRSEALWWLGAGLFPPLAFRVAVLTRIGSASGILDARGFASDAVSGLVVSLIAMGLVRLHRAAGLSIIGAWLLLCFGNSEHIAANGAHASLANVGFLADGTFVFGSLFTTTAPVSTAVIASITGGLAWRASRGDAVGLPTPGLGIFALVMTAGLLLWPTDITSAEWRQTGLVEFNFRSYTGAEAPLDTPATGTGAMPRHRREPADLSGSPRITFGTGRPNVLLILLEAISGAHIPSIANPSDVSSDLALPNLDRMARSHIAYTSFIAQQRQTNRGEFALLCGDWPKLQTGAPRMSEYVAQGGPKCLPEAMVALGYETVYLQAAPLAFMLKDQFMSRIGFGTVLGNTWFHEARSRTNWGVDDRTLFDGALSEAARLSSGDSPWFLTLLTVGTHHPYTVPDDFEAGNASGFARAALQADAAIAGFIDELGRQGILENTLVLITSDESVGLDEGASVDPLTLLLSRNWSFLIVLAPGATSPTRVDDPFLQSDLALSILDWLGADPSTRSEMGGRSIFRHYKSTRRLAFGNTYQGRITVVDPAGAIDICREDFSACSRFRGVPGRPFRAGANPERELTRPERHGLMTWLAGSSMDREPTHSSIELALVGEEVVPVVFGPARYQLVYGGQGLRVPAGSIIEVEIDVELRGEAGHTSIRTNLLAAETNGFIHTEDQRLETGDRLRLHVVVETGRSLSDLESRFVIYQRSGADLELVFRRARISIRPTEDAPEGSDPDVVVHESVIAHSPDGHPNHESTHFEALEP